MWICYEATDLDYSVASKVDANTLQHDKFYFQNSNTNSFN